MSGDPFEQAARIDDPIEHTQSTLGALVGGAIGVLAAVAIVGSGGTLLLAAGVIVGASYLGELAGSTQPRRADGIAEGAESVFIGAPDRNAARVRDEVACHSGEVIVSGCRDILIETLQAARAEEETRCSGKIEKDACCPTVYFGGPSVQVLPKRVHGELPAWLFYGREVLSVFTLFGGALKAVQGWRAMSNLMRAYEVAQATYGVVDTSLRLENMRAQLMGDMDRALQIEGLQNSAAYRYTSIASGVSGATTSIAEGGRHLGGAFRRASASPAPVVRAPGPPRAAAPPRLPPPRTSPPLALPAPPPRLLLPPPPG